MNSGSGSCTLSAAISETGAGGGGGGGGGGYVGSVRNKARSKVSWNNILEVQPPVQVQARVRTEMEALDELLQGVEGEAGEQAMEHSRLVLS